MPEINTFVVGQTLTEDSYTISIQFCAWFCITEESLLAAGTILFNVMVSLVDSLLTGNIKRLKRPLYLLVFSKTWCSYTYTYG